MRATYLYGRRRTERTGERTEWISVRVLARLAVFSLFYHSLFAPSPLQSSRWTPALQRENGFPHIIFIQRFFTRFFIHPPTDGPPVLGLFHGALRFWPAGQVSHAYKTANALFSPIYIFHCSSHLNQTKLSSEALTKVPFSPRSASLLPLFPPSNF